jgi:hypothetical protein
MVNKIARRRPWQKLWSWREFGEGKTKARSKIVARALMNKSTRKFVVARVKVVAQAKSMKARDQKLENFDPARNDSKDFVHWDEAVQGCLVARNCTLLEKLISLKILKV